MPPINRFASRSDSLEGPAPRIYAVTPADADLPEVLREIRVGAAGDVSVRDAAGNDILISNCAAGEKLPGLFHRINATGTTASNIVGWP